MGVGDRTVNWARAGQTEIGDLDQMVIGVNTQVASFSGDSLQGKPYTRGRHFKIALQLDPGL